MGPIRVTLGRTVGRARSLYSTAFAVGGFLATAALLLSRLLESAEGGALHLPALMTLAAAPVLPIFAALLGMDVWSDEKQSGRMDALMTIAVRERDFVLGKFAGVFLLLTLTFLPSGVSPPLLSSSYVQCTAMMLPSLSLSIEMALI